ncbi:MAG TPA: MOSC N-terminal beta barrel domain-containing protein [Rubrivivax sp.]|nr:MOSC N-terminal beta barrel domain-containing protein [Rubrivivax sp.]HPP83102.1 MOSC N-terminal beta barrel domain-containing protein [Rubrivivax sp.]
MSDIACRIAALHIHPVKSCAGIALDETRLVETGAELDRAWMVVDAQGEMLTQRTWPQLALVTPRLRPGELVLRAPGMLALHLRLDAAGAPTRVRVFRDEVRAHDMGDIAAQWFSDFLGHRLRLVRFDPDERRLASREWTGRLEAPTAFADGFPLLVLGAASLAELNARLQRAGHAAVGSERFRPNVVLDGLEAFDEDHLDELAIDGDDGPLVLRLVKPCVRCTIPNVDPASGASAPAVGDTLATFRADARMNGGVTFGMNAVVVAGVGRRLRVGQAVRSNYRF